MNTVIINNKYYEQPCVKGGVFHVCWELCFYGYEVFNSVLSVYSTFHQCNYIMLSIICFCVWPDIVLIWSLHITWNSSKHKRDHWELIFSATGGIGSNGCARTDLGFRAGRLIFNLWIPETNVKQKLKSICLQVKICKQQCTFCVRISTIEKIALKSMQL